MRTHRTHMHTLPHPPTHASTHTNVHMLIHTIPTHCHAFRKGYGEGHPTPPLFLLAIYIEKATQMQYIDEMGDRLAWICAICV